MASMDLAPGLSCSARSLILFIFGCTLAIVLMTFQYEHKLLLLNDPSLLLNLPSLSVICVCGLGAGSDESSDVRESSIHRDDFSTSSSDGRTSLSQADGIDGSNVDSGLQR